MAGRDFGGQVRMMSGVEGDALLFLGKAETLTRTPMERDASEMTVKTRDDSAIASGCSCHGRQVLPVVSLGPNAGGSTPVCLR
jgi:hypothetical protein